MNQAVRIEDKRRKELLRQMVQQREARLARPAPATPAPVHHVHVARGRSRREDVLEFLQDGELHTIPEIGNALGYKHTSVSALIRDLRKPKNGSHIIDTIRIDGDHYFHYIGQHSRTDGGTTSSV